MIVGFGATEGNGVPVAAPIGRLSLLDASGELAGAGVGAAAGFCGEDLGGGALGGAAAGAFGAAAVGAFGAEGAAAGLGAIGRVTLATGIFFTSGRWMTGDERAEGGAPATDGALFAGGAGRGVPVAEVGGMDSNSNGIASIGGTDAETPLLASTGAGGASLPESELPTPGTLETWIT